MANRFRNIVESIVYVGMRSSARPSPDGPAAKPGLFARFLSGPAYTDPLYLSNQTFGQRVCRTLLIATPLILVVGGVMAVIFICLPKTPALAKPPTSAEIRAKIVPIFDHEIKLDSNKDLEVLEVRFEHAGGSLMWGNLRNTTDHQIAEAVVKFDITDGSGSQLGGITVTETNLAPGAIRKFQQTIEQTNATYAVVRDVHTQ